MKSPPKFIEAEEPKKKKKMKLNDERESGKKIKVYLIYVSPNDVGNF